MLCENCQKNKAAVHLKTIINGVQKDYILCEECAAITESHISFDKLFHGFLDSFLNSGEFSFSENVGNSVQNDYMCPTCGITFEKFKEIGKLGCCDCYVTFGKQMETILKNIQGSSVHIGKFPKKYGSILQTKREIENLKNTLRKAIENEEYEEAARLRDAIKALEKAGDKNA